jgi:hypothetical protein
MEVETRKCPADIGKRKRKARNKIRQALCQPGCAEDGRQKRGIRKNIRVELNRSEMVRDEVDGVVATKAQIG